MGNIKKVLALTELEPRTLTANCIWTDLCENIHLHYRNTRLEFSEVEFAHFRAAINQCGLAVEMISDETNYREGNPNFLIQQMFNVPLKTDSDYYPNRSVIEFNRDNTVHFHYRDIRLHWTLPEFKIIAKMFLSAFEQFKTFKKFPYEGITERKQCFVDIDLIQPYDEGHRPGVIDEEHRKGADFVKTLIEQGHKIRPILINDIGQRLDGFKRYMAALELGHKTIECIIDPWGKMGGQHNQSFVLSSDKERIELEVQNGYN